MIARLPLPAFMVAAVLGYTLIGMPLLLASGASPSGAIATLAVPLPIVLFTSAWLGIELRARRRILPRLDPPCHTRAQARTERHGEIATLALAGAFCLSPIALPLATSRALSFTSFAPLICWAWIFHVFGMTRLRLASIILLRPSPTFSLETDDVRNFLIGMVLSRGGSPRETWLISATQSSTDGVPQLVIRAASNQSPPNVIDGDETGELALMVLATGNGDPYRLLHITPADLRVDIEQMSAHARMTALSTYQKSLDRLAEERLD